MPWRKTQLRDVGQRVTDLETTRKTARKAVIFVVGAIALQFVADAWGFITGLFKGPGP